MCSQLQQVTRYPDIQYIPFYTLFLQIRGTLKSWTKLWCVLKPGVLLIYKTHKNGQWVGTVLLNACELIERPSKKDGFCFKLFHPLEQSIWAVKVKTCHLLWDKISGPEEKQGRFTPNPFSRVFLVSLMHTFCVYILHLATK